MMRGIRRYYNKFRAYVVGEDGQHHQKYFSEYEDAKAFILSHRSKAIGNAKYKKRNGSIGDLPVGLCQTMKKKVLTDGQIVRYPTIIATVVINGRPKVFTRQYGITRTREQAIDICSKWRIKMLKKTVLK